MVQGINKTEKEYRAIPIDSSSSLKLFSQDRKKYFRLFIEGVSEDEEENKSVVMGKLVDCLLLQPEEFDNKFFLSACVSAPTGLMLAFCESLYKFTKEATDEEGNVNKSFAEISQDAYTESGFKIKYEAVLSKFIGSDAEIYYNEIREVRSKGLTVVTAKDVTNAENIVNELKNNEFTKDIINLVDSQNYTVRKQLQLEGFTIDKHPLKSMIDLLIIDHQKKLISIFDLKCTWSVEDFYTQYFLYHRSYIQALVYYAAAVHLKKSNEQLTDYYIEPLKFIVCDSSNYYKPLIYTLTDNDLEDAYNGFEYRGKYYPGVKTIIEELKWAQENNEWGISKRNYELKGIIPLRG